MARPIPVQLLAKCRELRRNETDAERLLWRLVRNRQLCGVKFRRQHPVGRYVVDFYCHEARLAVELDGGQHAEEDQMQRDCARTAYLDDRGVQVLRFWNGDVLKNPAGVLESIAEVLER